ncbi:MAG: hypothetical protein GW917_00470, partial [Bdellovibrionales bacterium]|nr:hypothetical protein [Bdellovibrionales bacterium]
NGLLFSDLTDRLALISKTSFNYLDQRTIEDSLGSQRKDSGNHQLQAHLGLEGRIGIQRIGATTGLIKVLKGKTEEASGLTYDDLEMDYLALESYARINLFNQVDLVPSVKYLSNLDNRDGAKIEIITGTIGVGKAF